MQRPRQPHVSASQLATFKGCPRRWFLQKVLQIKDIQGQTPATIRGQAVHYALEQYALHNRLPEASLPEWFDTAPRYNAEFERGGRVYKTPTVPELMEQCRNIANAMLLHVNPDRPGQVEVEFKLETAEGLPPVLGFIDVFDPERGLIRDWKVRSNAKKYGLNPAELAKDIQMNVYARKYFVECPDATTCTVEHVYADPNNLSNFVVQATIDRAENDEYWENLLDIIDLMMLCSQSEEEEIPRVSASCEQYGGCSYKDRCFPPSVFQGFEEMTTTEQALEALRAKRNEGTLGINPPGPPMPNLHTRLAIMSAEALNHLCGLWYQQREVTGVETDMRGRDTTQQCAFLTQIAQRRGWTLEALEPELAKLDLLYPFKEVQENKPLRVRETPRDEDTSKAVGKKRNGLKTPIRAHLLEHYKVAGMRSWIADDTETPRTQEYAQVQVWCRANKVQETSQTVLLGAITNELEARGATPDNFVELLNRPRRERGKTGAMPVNVDNIPVAAWEDVFLQLTSTACRRVAPEYAAQAEYLVQQGFIAVHPQQPEYYYVTAPGEWQALKEKRDAEAMERIKEELRQEEAREKAAAKGAYTQDMTEQFSEAQAQISEQADAKTELLALAQQTARHLEMINAALARLGVLL